MSKKPVKSATKKTAPKTPSIVIEFPPDMYIQLSHALFSLQKDYLYCLHVDTEALKKEKRKNERASLKKDIEHYTRWIEIIENLDADIRAQYQKIVYDALGD